jgi:hypothetical protein
MEGAEGSRVVAAAAEEEGVGPVVDGGTGPFSGESVVLGRGGVGGETGSSFDEESMAKL